MMGFGYGGGYRNVRYLRIGAIVALLLFGALAHDEGRAYDTVRLFYFALIIGLIAFSFRSRGARRTSDFRRQVNNTFDPIETRLVDAEGNPPPQMTQPGWYPHPENASIQRYWDGTAWGATRMWDGSAWVKS